MPAATNSTTSNGATRERRPRRPIVAKVRQLTALEIYAKAPDKNVEGFRARLKDIFATASPLFVEASMRQLLATAKLPDTAVPDTASLSASLELIASLCPITESEAALAVHIAALHMGAIAVLSRLQTLTERNVIAMATAAAKIERAFHGALETYQYLKRGATQIVRVERVEIQSGGQAVVGCGFIRKADRNATEEQL
jgi:hypothetical protein